MRLKWREKRNRRKTVRAKNSRTCTADGAERDDGTGHIGSGESRRCRATPGRERAIGAKQCRTQNCDGAKRAAI